MPADNSSETGGTTGQSAPDNRCGCKALPTATTTMVDNGERVPGGCGGVRSAASSSSDSRSPPSTVGPGHSEASSSSSVDSAAKRSANMTETVRVPTSEHVAEIVGRQGCKIKALRAKTNTYIKTPARGDEPVFVVTGRPEDVAEVKHEILSAAEHFSQIRASRRNASSGVSLRYPTTSSNEQVREKVAVPFWVVGLVVGPKGTTIRRIQQDTQTYIITPGKEKEPVFEIIGAAENVARARLEIESYVALRMRSRQSHAASLDNWAKLNELTQPQNEALRCSSHLASSGCLFDPQALTEIGMGQKLQNERNWRHSTGYLGRPVSVDVGEIFRCFPNYENLSFGEKKYLFQESVEKPQLEIEAVLSNCLSDLNLMSHDILKSLVNQESSLGLADLKPDRQQSFSSVSRMPFAVKSVPDDIIDYPLESVSSLYTVGSHSQL